MKNSDAYSNFDRTARELLKVPHAKIKAKAGGPEISATLQHRQSKRESKAWVAGGAR